jgi:hypothetical protein
VAGNGAVTEAKVAANIYSRPRVRWLVNGTEVPHGQSFTPPTITTSDPFHLVYEGEQVSKCKVQSSRLERVGYFELYVPLWHSDGDEGDAWNYSPGWAHTRYDFHASTPVQEPGKYQWDVECVGLDGVSLVTSTIHATITAP